MSLSGYEAPEESTVHEEAQESHLYDDEAEDTVTGATVTPPRPSSQAEDLQDTSVLESPTLAHAHSTPRAPHTGDKEPTFAIYSSPYESLKREMESGSRTPGLEPTTPGKTQALPNMELTESSPFVPPTSTKKRVGSKDPVLHHVLDKTYRIAATPHTTRKQKPSVGLTPATAQRGAPTLAKWAVDSSPPSSPAPQLRADIFSSPLKAPRTPGVSVQTPGRGKQAMSATTSQGLFDSDSEGEDGGMGFSPPKTMQFHIPQSRLLQTPGEYILGFLCTSMLLISVRSARGEQANRGRSAFDSRRRYYR